MLEADPTCRTAQPERINLRLKCLENTQAVQMDAPPPCRGTLVAYIYDGLHYGVSELVHDAQNCEYFVASDGTWKRCRPIVPSNGLTGDSTSTDALQVSYEQMMKATDVVTSRLAAFTPGFHGVHVAQHHPPVSQNVMQHTSEHFKRSTSLARVSSFVSDRHGHQTPTHHGTHG